MTGRHLNDEQLSAHLDGEGDESAAEHLASCPECEGRLAGLLLVSSLVGGSVPSPPEAVMEAAVRVARSKWSSATAGDESGADIVVLPQRRLPRWALPLAATAAAILVAVPLVASLDNGRGNHDTVATLSDTDAAGGADAESAGIDGGDLGNQSDPTSLAQAVRGALPGAATEAALAAPAPAPAEGADDGSGGPSSVPAPVSDGVAKASPAKAPRLGERPCAGIARTTYGQGLGPLVYAARVRWEGTPAVVLAYRLADAGGPGLDYRLLVMALQDCRLLVGQSL
ncbi:MAG TPA: zf-HC2 domain-containing protein [Acidimicrobiales bacterium]|nr:zf-HC2 domain-containing protein [Acidimicrobiales bacterium]